MPGDNKTSSAFKIADPVSTAVDTAINLFKIGKGIAQNAKAKKLEDSLTPLEYDIQQPILDNQALAESRASQGLRDASRVAYENNANRGLTTSIDAIIRGGAGINTFSDLYDSYADNFEQIAVMEEEIRARNEQNLLMQNERLAEELDKEWQINVFKPHQDKTAMIGELRGQGNANISGGLDGFGASASRNQMMNLYEKDARFRSDNTGNSIFSRAAGVKESGVGSSGNNSSGSTDQPSSTSMGSSLGVQMVKEFLNRQLNKERKGFKLW